MSQSQESHFFKEFLAGCIAGFSKIYTGQPFDIVKVRLQSAQGDVKPSPITIVKNIVKYEGGLTALWKGSLPPLLGIGATASLQFGVNENVKKIFNKRNNGKKMTVDQLFISGSLAGLANCIVSAPVENFRIRIQTQSKDNPIYKGSIDCIKKIYGEHGLRGVYKGIVPTLYRDSLGYGFYFAAFAKIMEYLAPGQTRSEYSLFKIGCAGSISGIILWGSVFPFDVVKTKIQTDSFEKPQYKGIRDCFMKTYQSKGISAFYSGSCPVS